MFEEPYLKLPLNQTCRVHLRSSLRKETNIFQQKPGKPEDYNLPKHICGATSRNELEFWGIPMEYLSECCIKTYFKYESEVEKIEEINRVFDFNDTGYSEEDCHNNKWTKFKRNVWIFLDQPTSSIPAKRLYNPLGNTFTVILCCWQVNEEKQNSRLSIYLDIYI
ncbi:hypothetical protein KUTeg_010007 [Tegillarca granosa]|uniref:Uncharacterized protein n=1 Tax=Tegillarca granosa TaxID=220873 RepID=A0ABQ9F5H9_TEGGR|nr:hypothetical protein KUTeg_010007 [Tegillarca granosa]